MRKIVIYIFKNFLWGFGGMESDGKGIWGGMKSDERRICAGFSNTYMRVLIHIYIF